MRAGLPDRCIIRKGEIRGRDAKAPRVSPLSDPHAGGAQMSKARVASVWLDGCSGCHMSILDMDERLIGLSDRLDLVYSPLVDTKEYPEKVDIVLVEGAVS